MNEWMRGFCIGWGAGMLGAGISVAMSDKPLPWFNFVLTALAMWVGCWVCGKVWKETPPK